MRCGTSYEGREGFCWVKSPIARFSCATAHKLWDRTPCSEEHTRGSWTKSVGIVGPW
jgi:hypothetical protein